MTRRAWLLVPLLLLAGCADDAPPSDGSEDAGAAGTLTSPPFTETETGPAPSSAIPPGPAVAHEAWFLDGCRQVFFYSVQEKESASQGLPPEHNLSGQYATVGLLAAECEASVRGNRSVVRDFRFAVTYQLLLPMGERAGSADADWYVREMVLEDDATAAELAAFGFPARVGAVALVDGPLGPEATVTADGLSYTAMGHRSQEPESSARDETRALRGASGERWFWLQVDAQRTHYVPVSSGSVVTATGGYLGAAMPGGLAPGTNQAQTEDLTVTFHELFA